MGMQIILRHHQADIPGCLESNNPSIAQTGIFVAPPPNLETIMENNELIDTLNTLIETSRDGDNGFTACADDAKREK